MLHGGCLLLLAQVDDQSDLLASAQWVRGLLVLRPVHSYSSIEDRLHVSVLTGVCLSVMIDYAICMQDYVS